MAFTFDCDFDLQAYRLSPVNKRQDVWLNYLYCIAEPIQSAHENFFTSYLEGDASAVWDIGTNYSRYDRVNYQNRIYQCVSDIIAELPTNTTYWVQVVGDFRGMNERIKYNSQKLMLEWILNRWFATNFEQPGGGTSDFYIVDNTRNVPVFTVPKETYRSNIYVSSSVFEQSFKTKKFVKETPNYASVQNFTVYYKLTDIPSITDDKYFQMVDLVNKYKVIGSTVTYTSY
jgi:hypothetical protein